MSERKKMTADEVFLAWKVLVKEIGKARFNADERREQLDMLCEMFFERGVDIDEAKMYKRKIVEFMVTKEGMKGNGRHKGWKETTEEDFIGNLAMYYKEEMDIVNDTTHMNKATKINEIYGGRDYMDRTALIVAWSKHKFKSRWSEAICLEAHKVGSQLWTMFKKEVINSKWAKSGERPDWAKNVY